MLEDILSWRDTTIGILKIPLGLNLEQLIIITFAPTIFTLYLKMCLSLDVVINKHQMND